MSPWQALGVSQDVGVADLRRRYAALIKEFRPETHPQDFARIREAYEFALPFARRREAEAVPVDEDDAAPDLGHADLVEDALPAPAVDPYPAPDDEDDDPLSVEDEIAIGDTAIATLLATGDAGADGTEPGLAAQFRRFHAAAEAAVGTHDEAWLPELRALLQARTQATLDDSQALEFALMRWFLEAEMPPLTLLFETGRAFDWHSHIVRLSSWLSPWALRHMEQRLALSRDLVFARHFSGNAWLRRVHAPRAAWVPLANRVTMLEAEGWVQRWQRASEDADAAGLAASLNPHVLRQLGGRQLLSTDVLLGLVFATTADAAVEAALYAAVGTAAVFAARLALRRLRPAPGRYRLPAMLVDKPGVAAVLVIGLAGIGGAIFATPDLGTAAAALAMLLIAPAILLGLCMAWIGMSWLERGVAELFAWRDAVDRLEFDRFVNARTAPDPAAPFGTRLGPGERLKAIPAALRLRGVEIALRARPVRPRPRLARVFTFKGRTTSVPRMLWFGAWVVFAILRLAHVIGH